MRIFLDTNVLVSALIKPGKPRTLLDATVSGRHKLVTSRPMIEELSRVVTDERIRKYVTSKEARGFLRLVTATASTVEITSRTVLFRTADDMVLRTAYDGQTKMIVTGDRHLLNLRAYRAISILGVSDAIDALQ